MSKTPSQYQTLGHLQEDQERKERAPTGSWGRKGNGAWTGRRLGRDRNTPIPPTHHERAKLGPR